MTNLPQLEEKIYSLVPELKWLTPGCKIRIGTVKIVNKKAVEQYEKNQYIIADRGCEDVGEWGPEYQMSDTYIIIEQASYCRVSERKKMIEKVKVQDFRQDDFCYEIIGHEIHPHHWLPLLESYAMDGYGNIFEAQAYMNKWNRKFTQLNIKYDFKKSFKDQSPEFHKFLLENIK